MRCVCGIILSIGLLIPACISTPPGYRKNDTLEALKAKILTADTDEGDVLLICPEDVKTKLRTIIVPDQYKTGIVFAHFGMETELVRIPVPRGEDASICDEYDAALHSCVVERLVPEKNTYEEELAKRKNISPRHLAYANSRGQLVTKDGERLGGTRSSMTTSARSCGEL